MNIKDLILPVIRQRCAVVVSVGASHGISTGISRRIGYEGLLVYVAGRTPENWTGWLLKFSRPVDRRKVTF